MYFDKVSSHPSSHPWTSISQSVSYIILLTLISPNLSGIIIIMARNSSGEVKRARRNSGIPRQHFWSTSQAQNRKTGTDSSSSIPPPPPLHRTHKCCYCYVGERFSESGLQIQREERCCTKSEGSYPSKLDLGVRPLLSF